jgi:uncharacterized protein DUF4189
VTQPLKLLLIASIALLALAQQSRQSAGQCLYECQGSTCSDFSNNTSMCVDLRAKCQSRCSGRRWWGAIAYSQPDAKFGFSFEWNRVEDAKKTAMDNCSKRGGSACKLWVWFENECGAIAADGKIVTWGTAYLRENAERRAIEECHKAGGRNCSIPTWVCSKM